LKYVAALRLAIRAKHGVGGGRSSCLGPATIGSRCDDSHMVIVAGSSSSKAPLAAVSSDVATRDKAKVNPRSHSGTIKTIQTPNERQART